ncbi:hypothetical protein [Micromonospora sp. KC207]|uniref:hypothetical protein n=1 Tax=Micromonospora sp. KC207 TaxID=2530377 RepID=UPI001A9F876D|nr:hypothetical protein [Micromonospora sp. KC207]
MTPLEAGLWTAPPAVGVIGGSLAAPRLARRIPAAHIIGAGLLVSAAGYLILATAGSLATVVASAIVISAGLGPMMALSTNLAIGAAPPDRAGAAAAMASAAPQLGGALGVAVLGSIITVVYRSHTPETHTLTVGADQASRDAYLTGIHIAALTSTVLVTLAATAVIRTGRTRREAETDR